MEAERGTLESPVDPERRTSRAPAYTGHIRVREGIAYAVAAVLSAMLSLVRVPFYSRWFSPEVYGEFTVVSTASTLASGILLAVFSDALYRYYDEYRRSSELHSFLSSIAAGVVTAFSAVAVGVVVVRNLWDAGIGGALTWWLVLFVISCTQGLLAQINRVEHQTGGFLVGRLIDPLLQLGGPVVLLSAGFPAQATIFGTAILGGASSLAVGAIWARKQLALAKPWKAGLPVVLRVLRYGLPLVPLALVNWVLSSSDRYMVQWLLGSEATGIYAMGYSLAWMPISMVSSVLVLVMGPSVWERANTQGESEAMALVQRFVGLYLAMAVPGSIGLTILASRVVGVLLGPQYAVAANVVGPASFAAAFGGLRSFFVKPWELKEATRQLLLYVGISAVISVILNVWTVPALGVAGPGWSALVAHCTMAVLLLWRASRQFGIYVGPTMRDLRIIGFASVLMLLVVRTIRDRLPFGGIASLGVAIGLGACVYVAAWLPFQRDLVRWFQTQRART